jgi:hypothetical protein
VEDQINIIMADLDRYTRGEVITLGININANLRSNPPLGTPIDTGWASANWVPSVGQPFIDPAAEQVKDPTPAQVAARGAVAQKGVNEVLAWRSSDGSIFSSNNVPYIGPLNAGHSPQSPRGFILTAIERAIRQTYSMAGNRAARMGRADAFRARSGKPPRSGR